MKLVLITTLSALFYAAFFHQPASAFLVKKKNWPVHARGRITCDGQPMPYVRVKLMDKDLLADQTMGSTRTYNNGYFRVSGSGRDGIRGKPDPYILVIYEYRGSHGRLEIEKIFGINRKEKSKKKNYSKYINFGTLNFRSIHCRAYRQFYRALKDFHLRARVRPPYKALHVRTSVIIHGGTPYATTDKIRIPRKKKTISFETAKHELAHTIRQSYDGSFAHFLYDVGKYKYMKTHHCGKKTNNGFAFNEGWAEYWAGSCKRGPYGSSATNYSYEGNVAAALRKLQSKCHKYRGPSKMVAVLRRSGKKKIHSFNSFNSQHYKYYRCKL